MQTFKTRTFGKWILAGEHAVLRGCPALAFPLTSRYLELEYFPGPKHLEVEFCGEHGEELRLLFYGVIENALTRLKVPEPLTGKFTLTNTLPVGAGLGASAALCGAVARWCLGQAWIEEKEVYEFARQLENLFHGESSGVDLAVSLSVKGLRFVRGGEKTPIELRWWPKLYLSYCGQRGMTAECVTKVKRLFETNPEHAKTLDLQMAEAVGLAESALAKDEGEGFGILKHAMDLSRDCFEQWELADGMVHTHMRYLQAHGASAVKPTGSGGGGFVLSLWKLEPASDLLLTKV